MKLLRLLPPLFVGAALAGCVTTDQRLPSQETQYLGAEQPVVASRESGLPPWDNVSYWDGQGLDGPARVEIDLGAQRAYFYKGGKLAGVSTVSTGREGFNTPPGTFHITQKNANHRSNLFGDYVDAAGDVVVKDLDKPLAVWSQADRSYVLVGDVSRTDLLVLASRLSAQL